MSAVVRPLRVVRRGWPLQRKLIGVVLLTTFVSLLVALAAMVGYDLWDIQRNWSRDMATRSLWLGRNATRALVTHDVAAAEEALLFLRSRDQVQAAAVYDTQGRLMAHYPPERPADHVPAQPGPSGTAVNGREMEAFSPVFDHGQWVGTVYLRSRYVIAGHLLGYGVIALAVLLVSMAVAWLLSLRLQRVVSRPILSVATVARDAVAQRDFSRRVQRQSNDEVGVLAESFNELMDEIERRVQEADQALAKIAQEVAERREAELEVKRLNAELEQRVEERTAQLEASNRELARATETAEKANRAKSEFISSMSHELRTPLNAILGFGQLMVTPGLPLNEGKRTEFTQHILKAGHHLLNLINEVLDLARIESSSLLLSLEPVELSELLNECRTMLEPTAAKRSVRMVFPVGLSMHVMADRTRLKQVLLNLLSNAIKYNREQGTVTVEYHVLADDLVRVLVRDTGAGLKPEQVGALFQPFNRLGQESGAVEGTGIGLVVTKRLVELMGGFIGARSTPGQGSEFWVELTLAEALPPIEDVARLPAVRMTDGLPPETPLLLYVEDNPANLQLVQEIVAVRGDLRMLSAPDAQLGLELARQHLPRVILMDINLPGLSGIDALALLATDVLTRHIPVIAVTANAMARDRLKGMSAGFYQYLTKPINIARLNEAIDSALAVQRSPATD